MYREFEIVYADRTLVHGTTAQEFKAAPDDGIQFVIIRIDSATDGEPPAEDACIQTLKGLDVYEYDGVQKPGSFTDRENYDQIKRDLTVLSSIKRPTKVGRAGRPGRIR